MLHRIIVLFIHCIYSYWWYFSWDYLFIHCIYAYWILILFLVGTIDYRWVQGLTIQPFPSVHWNHWNKLIMSHWSQVKGSLPLLFFSKKIAGHLRLQDHGGDATRWRHEQRIGTLALRSRIICMFWIFLVQNSWWKPPLLIHISQKTNSQCICRDVWWMGEWGRQMWRLPVGEELEILKSGTEPTGTVNRHHLCLLKLGDAFISSLNPTVSRVSMLQKWNGSFVIEGRQSVTVVVHYNEYMIYIYVYIDMSLTKWQQISQLFSVEDDLDGSLLEKIASNPTQQQSGFLPVRTPFHGQR